MPSSVLRRSPVGASSAFGEVRLLQHCTGPVLHWPAAGSRSIGLKCGNASAAPERARSVTRSFANIFAGVCGVKGGREKRAGEVRG